MNRYSNLAAGVLLCAVAASALADEPKKDEVKKVEAKKAAAKPRPGLPEGTRIELLWPQGAPGAMGDTDADKPSIGIYLAPADKANGCAVVVCPGGGYGGLAMGHEGHQVAQWLNGLGVSAFVLKYRLGPRYHHPAPISDAQRALRTVRAKAKEFGIDPARVGILGFSAGGHLASTAATHFDDGKPDAADPVDRAGCRPDFAVLIYPVITLEPPAAHMGSRNNLLGKDAEQKLVESLCNERQVTAKTPPTFLVHSKDDKAVPTANSEMFLEACKKAGVPCEMTLYEKGGHGYGLGRPGIDAAAWPEKCAAWMKDRGLLTKKE